MPGAGADEVLDQHLLRGVGVAELERGVDLGDRLVPAQLLLVDQLARAAASSCALVFDAIDEERVRVDLVGLAQLAHAEAALVDDLAVVDEARPDAGDVELLHAAVSTKSLSAAMRSASSGCAFLPANDSRV